MALYLVETDRGMTLELEVPPCILQALQAQFRLSEHDGDGGEFCRRLSAEIEKLLPHALSWKLKEPTGAQLAFAISICRQLRIELPDSATKSRGEMHRFIAVQSLRLSAK